jgi:hypothetical protein
MKGIGVRIRSTTQTRRWRLPKCQSTTTSTAKLFHSKLDLDEMTLEYPLELLFADLSPSNGTQLILQSLDKKCFDYCNRLIRSQGVADCDRIEAELTSDLQDLNLGPVFTEWGKGCISELITAARYQQQSRRENDIVRGAQALRGFLRQSVLVTRAESEVGINAADEDELDYEVLPNISIQPTENNWMAVLRSRASFKFTNGRRVAAGAKMQIGFGENIAAALDDLYDQTSLDEEFDEFNYAYQK